MRQIHTENPANRNQLAVWLIFGLTLLLAVYVLKTYAISASPNWGMLYFFVSLFLLLYLSFVVINKPLYGLFGVILLIPFQYQFVLTSNLSFYKFYFFWFSILVFFRTMMLRKKFNIDRTFLFLLFGYFLVLSASVLNAQHPTAALKELVIYASRASLIFVIPLVIRNEVDFSKMVHFFLWTGVVVTILGIIQLLTPVSYRNTSGIFGAVGVGEYYNYLIPIILSLFLLEKEPLKRKLLLGLLFLDLIMVISSGSRSAWGVTLFILALFLMFQGQFRPRLLRISVLAFVIVGVGYMYLPNQEVVYLRFEELLERGMELGSRDERMRHALNLFSENPWLGIGLSGYSQWSFANWYQLDFRGSTHNVPVLVLAETGVLGLLFISSLFVYTANLFVKSYRSLLEPRTKLLLFGFLIAFFAWIAEAQFHGLSPFTTLPAFSMGVALAVRKMLRSSCSLELDLQEQGPLSPSK